MRKAKLVWIVNTGERYADIYVEILNTGDFEADSVLDLYWAEDMVGKPFVTMINCPVLIKWERT